MNPALAWAGAGASATSLAAVAPVYYHHLSRNGRFITDTEQWKRDVASTTKELAQDTTALDTVTARDNPADVLEARPLKKPAAIALVARHFRPGTAAVGLNGNGGPPYPYHYRPGSLGIVQKGPTRAFDSLAEARIAVNADTKRTHATLVVKAGGKFVPLQLAGDLSKDEDNWPTLSFTGLHRGAAALILPDGHELPKTQWIHAIAHERDIQHDQWFVDRAAETVQRCTTGLHRAEVLSHRDVGLACFAMASAIAGVELWEHSMTTTSGKG
jgi:hypothetical protein